MSGEFDTVVREVAPKIVGFLVRRFAGAVVDNTFDERAETNKMFDEVATLVQESKLPRTNAEISQGFTDAQMQHEQSREPKSRSSDMTEHLIGSLENLNSAYELTNCGSCRRHIETAKAAVVEEIKPIIESVAKLEAMDQLKAEGKLDKDLVWDTMDGEQRAMILQRYHDNQNEEF